MPQEELVVVSQHPPPTIPGAGNLNDPQKNVLGPECNDSGTSFSSCVPGRAERSSFRFLESRSIGSTCRSLISSVDFGCDFPKAISGEPDHRFIRPFNRP